MRFVQQLFIATTIISISAGFSACSAGTMGEERDAVKNESMKDWKWYEYQSEGYTLYSKDPSSENVIIEHTGVQLPFFDNTSPAGKDLFRYNLSQVDMYPEDGWVLVKVNFGTSIKAPNMPYLILYHRTTGILRYIFYNSKRYDDYSYAVVNLEQKNDTSSILSFFDDDDCFVDKYDSDKMLTTITGVIKRGWNYADFVISYDPSVAKKKNLCFYITVYVVNESDLTLEGDKNIKQIMDNSQLHLSGSINSEEFIKANQKGIAYFRNANIFFNYCNSESGTWYSDQLEYALGDIVTRIGTIAGIFSSVIFGSKDSHPVPVNFQSHINFSRTIKKTAAIDDLVINVPGTIVDSNYLETNCDYNKPLGIFSIQSKPVVDVTITTTDSVYIITSTNETSVQVSRSDISVSSIKMSNEFPLLVFNNIDGYYIDSVECGFVFSSETAINFKAIGGDYLTTDEFDLVRIHESNPVNFVSIEDFKNFNLNYTQSFGRSFCYEKNSNFFDGVFYYSITTQEKISCISRIHNAIAPEIVIKVTLFSVNDIEKQNPIIHLKRVRSDYNLYWYNNDSGVTNALGSYIN